jgi:predicted small integral membrane protein
MSMDLQRVLRLSKAAVMACVCGWSMMAAFDNLTDYASNFEFVRHVLAMDTTFPGNAGMWRAISWTPLYHLAYALIIAAELAIGALAGLSAVRMVRHWSHAELFRPAKAVAVIALTLGILLWLGGFEVIAGEFFMMWQSRTWNAQESAFRFVVVFALALIFVAQDE